MAEISGRDGDVTFANGFTTNVHSWRLTDSAPALDTTAFGNTWRDRPNAQVSNWEGEYNAWKSATVNTDFATAGDFYSDSTVFSYTIELVADDLLTTPFGSNYNTRIAGLFSASGSYEAYIDDGIALPVAGSTETITLTLDAGETYSIPARIITAEARVSADGADRIATISWESNGTVTTTSVPDIGVTGAATFEADTGRTYSGTILVTRIGITMTAQRDSSEFVFGFVGNGTNTAA